MISPEADPPVARLMNYSKYRYEQEQKAKDAKKKIASSRQDQKELKMRRVSHQRAGGEHSYAHPGSSYRRVASLVCSHGRGCASGTTSAARTTKCG